ncbi:MAG: 30S ribosomal protein S17 [Deltaproteobacteria bacterium]|nr:MAG: 30S ribosomal protein S17 [Deltaproteobacteria bacterium]
MKKYKRFIKEGEVIKLSSNKTIIVRTMSTIKHPKYHKIIKRFSNYHVHDEDNNCQLGDKVEIRETRPLSKIKRWKLESITSTAKERIYDTSTISS